MDEPKLKKQTSMVTKSSSIKRKPLANLTNIARKPNHSSSFTQSKKSGCSTASESSIGSTKNPIKSDHLASEEKQAVQGRRNSRQNAISNSEAVFPFYVPSLQGKRNNVKEGSVSVSSSTSDKSKDEGCLDKTIDKEKRKSVDVPLSVHRMKNADNSTGTPIPRSTEKVKDKGKENVVQSGCSLTGSANSNMGITMSDSLQKRKDKGKAIAEPFDYLSRKKLKNNMMEFRVPLKGVVIKEREDSGTGSGSVKLAEKDKGKGVSAPVTYHTLEKDQQRSCPPILRTMSKRNVADETEDVLQSKLQTEPPPNKKKRIYSAKEVKEEYKLPQDYVEQQRAYFKEIDDFELLVEEV